MAGSIIWHLCILFLIFVIAHKGRHYYLHFRDEDSGAQGGKEICLRTQPLNQASDKNDLSDTTVLCYSHSVLRPFF